MITDVTLATTKCPRCGAEIVSDQQYVTWCEHCEWNLDPRPAQPAKLASSRAKQRRGAEIYRYANEIAGYFEK